MEFVRKKKRGQNAKVQRTWLSEEGYRIHWRKEAFGVEMTPAYMACVRVMVPNVGQDWYTMPELDRGKPKSAIMWDFVDPAHHLQKKLKTAQATCEKHQRLWTKACETTGIRGIIELFGKVPSAIPMWVKSKLPKKVLEVLTRPPHLSYNDEDEEECQEPTLPDGSEPSRPDPIEISPTLFQNTSTSPSDSGPASPVVDEDGTTTRKTRRVRLKATEVETPSPAPPAEAPAKGRKPRVSKPTEKPSKGSKRKPTTTKRSSKSAKTCSKGSRKRKSAPSKN